MARNATNLEAQSREKSKKVQSLWSLKTFFAPYKLTIVAAILALLVTACISLILPIAVRRIVDGFQTEGLSLLDSYFFAALFIALLLAIGTGLRYYLVTKLGERVIADMRAAVFARMIQMSPAFYEKIMTGEVLSRLTTDTTLILSVISSSISVALRNFVILIGGFAMLLITSLKLTGLILLIVPIVLVPIIVFGRHLRKLSNENQTWIANSSASASEALLAAQTVQAFTAENFLTKHFNRVVENSFLSAKTRVKIRAYMTVVVISLIFSGVVSVLWIGARDVRAELITIGELVQFVIYAIMVAGAAGALSEIWGELQRAAGATERLVELLNAKDPIEDKANPIELPQPATGQISFENVQFNYPSRKDLKALDDVSFEINQGETIAFVGPSGAGKSTIMQLLQRFYDPQNGTIKIDGIPLNEMNRQNFRQSIALVPQDPAIFASSVKDNITFGCEHTDQESIENAAKAAAAHDFISQLPDGYNTFVGERGIMLSGGQKQRIAIARAILRDAPILLLDEATSALDSASEQDVQRAIEDMAQTRTTLIIAHRLATVKKADRIFVLDQGKIVEMGRHENLIKENGLYARLAKLQFGVNES